MADEAELRSALVRLGAELDNRVSRFELLDAYYDGNHPLPPLVQEQRLTRAYKTLMALSPTNWPQAIVDATESRLEIQGVRFGDDEADKEVWDLWQANGLDAESSLLHQTVLADGRGYAIVWGDGKSDPQPTVTYEHPSMCVVEYEAGTRRKRKQAMRRWFDGSHWYANLYTREFVYKFRATAASRDIPAEAIMWQRYEPATEPWPLPNPLEDVPVVEFAINRSLRPGVFGHAQGDFERNLGHIDRINYKVFSGLVALTWSGFPLRYVIGDPITRDDEGNAVAPFDAIVNAVAQFENPNAKVGQLPEANVENYSAKDDIVELAAVTSTPVFHLLPGEMVNISADAMRAGQDSHVSKVKRYHRTLGEAHEDVTRLMLRVKDPKDPRGFDTAAEMIWKEPEHRSLAERADAYTKLQDLPWQVKAALVLGMTPREIDRAQAQSAMDVLNQAVAQTQAQRPAEPAVSNGLPRS